MGPNSCESGGPQAIQGSQETRKQMRRQSRQQQATTVISEVYPVNSEGQTAEEEPSLEASRRQNNTLTQP
jgi:hypothetical protein